MAQKVLITGGSGLIGQHLTPMLQERGYAVSHLSTNPNYRAGNGVKSYLWKPEYGKMDPQALDGTGAIIHLAGANLNQRWSESAKRNILQSRVESSLTLYHYLRDSEHSVKSLISASGVSFYPSDKEKLFTEKDKGGKHFTAMVVQRWEDEVMRAKKSGVRVCCLRTGAVLSRSGGLLSEMAGPLRFGLGAPLGDGKQWISWIHIDDICRAYIHLLESDELSGVFNAVAPQAVRNKDFMKLLSKMMKKPYFMPPVPALLLKIFLGQMSQMALMSQKVSPQKLIDSGFSFRFETLEQALEDLLNAERRDHAIFPFK